MKNRVMEVFKVKLVVCLLFVSFSEISGNSGFYWPAAQEDASIMDWSEKPHQLWCGSNPDERTFPPNDYKLIPNLSYYKYYAFGASWDVAKRVCEEDGASLVIVNSDKEAVALAELRAANPVSTGAVDQFIFWTGIHERGVHGMFYTPDGQSLINSGFWKWNAAEPNDLGLDDAVAFHGTTKMLMDAVSTQKYAFVCEIEVQQIEPRKKWFQLKRLQR